MSSPSYSSDSPRMHQHLEDVSNLLCHELRTPLTSIQGVLGILELGQFDHSSEEGQRLLGIAFRAANRLTKLANLLELQSEELPSMLSTEDMERLKLADELSYGFAHQEFFLNYQPIISLTQGRIVGFEALARWHHPSRGAVSPEIFIPIAEKSGLIHQLDLFLFEQACKQLHVWQVAFPSEPPLTMSINLSSTQLSQVDLSEKVHRILANHDIAPGTVQLEVTESALIQSQDQALTNLYKLKDSGIRIYLDDFGTGYSSLSRLQEFPVDAIKIDRSFIMNHKWTMSEAIFLLASRLELDVIAEGIETPEQLKFLKEIGCNKMQGYYFSRPMDSRSISQLLHNNVLHSLLLEMSGAQV
ncbi:MAG: EAL domain-containing protein [Cyanobacteria bacterium P01_H01_bin.58]